MKSKEINEDQVDLIELWNTIAKKKKMIFISTTIITIVGVLIAYMKTPLYEAQALIEVGSYKIENNNNGINSENIINTSNIDDPNKLAKRLNVLYIDVLKNKKNKNSFIESIVIPKGSKEFIEIRSTAISNKLAKKEIENITYYLKEKHGKILENIKKNRKLEIFNIDLELNNIKNKSFPLFNKKIKEEELSISQYKLDLKLLEENLKIIRKTNPTLAALLFMEKRDLQDNILKLKENVFNLKEKMNNSLVQKMNELSNRKTKIESLTFSHNYKNTQIVGEIITNEYATKPKKKSIIIIFFVIGVIISIFLAFFLEFISKRKEESKKNS